MFPCPECGKGPFDTAIDLQLHQREFHVGNKAVVAMDVNNAGAITAHHQPVAETAPLEPNLSLRGALPDDFPHVKELRDAGYDTYGKVRKLVAKGDDWFRAVPGIADKKAPDVITALTAKPESEDEE